VSQQEYMHSRHSTLLEDYLREETRLGERLVVANEHFSALVPFWAVWPYEVMIVTHHPVAHLADLSPEEQASLAAIYQQVTQCYDRLFGVAFPYSMVSIRHPLMERRILNGCCMPTSIHPC